MSTTTSSEARQRAQAAADVAAAAIREARRGKKGGKRRDPVLCDLRDSERHVLRAGQRLARAVDAGLETYAETSAETREERGEVEAFVLAPVHVMKGAAKALHEAADVPADLAKALDTKTFRRAVRLTVLPPLRGGRRD